MDIDWHFVHGKKAMTQELQVKCIRKTNRYDPHERIHGIGGTNPNGTGWYLPLDDAIAGIESGTWKFWTAGGGPSVWVIIAAHNGRKYLKTTSDGEHPNNLLSLPECP
jgi:Protein of unknown function (DUF3892)